MVELLEQAAVGVAAAACMFIAIAAYRIASARHRTRQLQRTRYWGR